MGVAIKHQTLADAVVPSVYGLPRVALALLCSGLIALSAQLVIWLPYTPVPVTGQTLAVVLTGALLGPRWGVLAVLFYIAEGSLGWPVFHGGTGGWIRLIGPTGGYLVGFVVAAFVVGCLARRGWDRRFLTALAMMLAGQAVILALGAAWLAQFGPVGQALINGVIPFLPGELIKSLLAAAALPFGWKILAQLGNA